jgi:hypothetical protein
MRRSKGKCLTPGCKKDAETRGLCNADYKAANRKVVSGEVTWEQLEASGLALAPHAEANARNPMIRAIAGLLSSETPQPQ